MHPLRLLALIGIALPVFAATPLSLHRGSTREWVRYTGTKPDSVRYRLEFLDSTSRSTSSEYKASYIPPGGTVCVDKLVPRKDLVTEWKVRVTIPDSPSVVDTAILRVVGVTIDYDVFKTGSTAQILNLAYWYKPSVHCPIDVQINPVTEVQRYLTLGVGGGSISCPTVLGSSCSCTACREAMIWASVTMGRSGPDRWEVVSVDRSP